MKEVTIEEFQTIVENEEDINIIDVRPRELYEEGHVPGAVHFPLSEIEGNLDKFDKNDHYYAICNDGNGSKKATEILTDHGYDVTNVEKGVPDYPGKLETEE